MSGSWEKTVTDGQTARPKFIGLCCRGPIIMDFSKAFDSVNYELLLAKPKSYNLDNNSALSMRSYFTNWLQHCKVNKPFIEWEKVLPGVPQGSVHKWNFSVSSRVWPSKL